MNAQIRTRLLLLASVTATVASFPATGLRGVLFGFSGAAFGLAALLSMRNGGAR